MEGRPGRVALIVAVLASLIAVCGAPRANADGVPAEYVSLGDSYTSAPLVSVPVGDPIDCGQSDRNYPRDVQAVLRATVFRDVSCGSAQTDDLSSPQTGLPLGGTNPAQLDALDADVALVTLGIGGNDIGFGSIIADCVQLPTAVGGTPCTTKYTSGGTDVVSDRIARTAPKIAAALAQIHARAPQALVLVVGYPAILPDTGTGCYPYVPVLPDDVPYLRAKEKELNAMLQAQAEANGATYVDAYTSSIGHDACQLPGIAWVNAIVLVPPSYPGHPNLLGEANTAQQVLAVLHAHG